MNAVLGIGLALMCAAADAPVDVSVRLEPPVIPYHRQAAFTISVEAPADLEVHLPEMTGKFGGLDVADVPDRNVENLKGGRKRLSETYTLDPVFVGDYPVEPVEVTWGEDGRVVVPSPVVRVRELTEAETAAAERFEPNAPTRGLPSPYAKWPVWAGAIAALAVLAGGFVWWRLRNRGGEEAAPEMTPWERAYARLHLLDERGLPEAGKHGPYYVDLSDILRSYIEDRFDLHAPERTTPEFLAEASGSGLIDPEHQMLVAHLLRHCDLVKFAQHQPSVREMESSFADVLKFVDDTVPKGEGGEEEAVA